MLLITLFALIFKPWQINLEHIMIEFADVMNKMVNDEEITNNECLQPTKGINKIRKGLKIIGCLVIKE